MNTDTDPTKNPEYLHSVQSIVMDAALRSKLNPLQTPENFVAAARAFGLGIAKVAVAMHPDEAGSQEFLRLVNLGIQEEYAQQRAKLNAFLAERAAKPPQDGTPPTTQAVPVFFVRPYNGGAAH